MKIGTEAIQHLNNSVLKETHVANDKFPGNRIFINM